MTTRSVDRIYAVTGRPRGLAFGILWVSLLCGGCIGARTVEQSIGHLEDRAEPVERVPPAVVRPPPKLEPPEPLPPVETYTVVAKDVPVADLLFSLAVTRDLT